MNSINFYSNSKFLSIILPHHKLARIHKILLSGRKSYYNLYDLVERIKKDRVGKPWELDLSPDQTDYVNNTKETILTTRELDDIILRARYYMEWASGSYCLRDNATQYIQAMGLNDISNLNNKLESILDPTIKAKTPRDMGLCRGLQNHLPRIILHGIFSQWEYFSEDFTYPIEVNNYAHYLCPRGQYQYYSCHYSIDEPFTRTYDAARMNLAKHIYDFVNFVNRFRNS